MAGWTVVPNPATSAWKPVQPAVAGAGPMGLPQPTNLTPQQMGKDMQPSAFGAAVPALKTMRDIGIGALKGAGTTANNIGHLIEPDWAVRMVGATPPTPGQEAAPLTPKNTAQKVGLGGEQIGEYFLPTGIESGAAKLGAELGPKLGTAAKIVGSGLHAGIINKAQGGDFTTGAAMGAAGGAAGELLPMLKPALQDSAIGKINRKIGALKPDFARGANPGEGYFQARLGPSASMGSIAEKASAAKENVGEQIGNAVDNNVLSRIGVKIPVQDAVRPIAEPINETHAVLSGPGGGDTGAIEDLSASFRPAIQKAVDNGGFTPREYFAIKRNVAKNTGWGDPAQIGLKQARQQIAGGMSGTLGEQVPELRPLTSAYQNLSKLETRATDRATTGRPSLSGVGRGITEAGLAAGGLLKKGPAGLLLGAIPAVADSIPIQTGIASGMYYGGEALPRVAPLFGRFAPPTVLALGKKKVVNSEQ